MDSKKMNRLFHQEGRGRGKEILLIGESPSARGWHHGFACHNLKGGLLPSGKRLNDLLLPFRITVDDCGFTELSQEILEARKFLNAFAEKGWSIFLKGIKERSYRLFIILGAETTRVFSRLAQTELKTGELTKATIAGKSYFVLPIYHPSPINPMNRQRNEEIFTRHAKALKAFVK